MLVPSSVESRTGGMANIALSATAVLSAFAMSILLFLICADAAVVQNSSRADIKMVFVFILLNLIVPTAEFSCI